MHMSLEMPRFLAAHRVEHRRKRRDDAADAVPLLAWTAMALTAVVLFGCLFLAIQNHLA